uniref:Cysteine protease n=1 Tax=Syphacia muris TaxID=451379 RepID=A0A0N5ABY9_9BILA
MSVATISSPAVPLTCHPETNPCPVTGTNTECQFSFRSFMYVCCQDRDDVRPPVCPKYHDTLGTFCGGSRSMCPRGYKCMKSRYDPNIELCCHPNRTLKHPEPETSFVDHEVTPMIIPKAPRNLLKVNYKGTNLTVGQLISNENIADLEDEPQLYANNFEDDKLYTILMFDLTRDNAPAVLWLDSDVSAIDGRLISNEKRKSKIAYQRPNGDEPPQGTHIVVVAVFEQNDNWAEKNLRKLTFEESGSIKEWINTSANISKRPIAGTLFGVSFRNA